MQHSHEAEVIKTRNKAWEKKRSIKLLRRDFLDQFVTEFEELVRSKVR